MLARLGSVASVLSEDVSTSRACRLKNATPLRIRQLIGEHLTALGRVVTVLERHTILLYRITSNLIPFASHPINPVEWWSEFAPQLSEIGRRVRALVVENDDRLFDAVEMLSIGQRLDLPVVFDWLRHNANPCRARLGDVLPEIFATWRRDDGPPKVHLSSQTSLCRYMVSALCLSQTSPRHA